MCRRVTTRGRYCVTVTFGASNARPGPNVRRNRSVAIGSWPARRIRMYSPRVSVSALLRTTAVHVDLIGQFRGPANMLPADARGTARAHSASGRGRRDRACGGAQPRRSDDERTRLEKLTGCDEAIFLNERGELTEGSRTNIFVRRGGRLLTPPLSAGVLDGVFRRELIEQGRCEEAMLTPDELAGEVFLGNSLRGLISAGPARSAARACGRAPARCPSWCPSRGRLTSRHPPAFFAAWAWTISS